MKCSRCSARSCPRSANPPSHLPRILARCGDRTRAQAFQNPVVERDVRKNILCTTAVSEQNLRRTFYHIESAPSASRRFTTRVPQKNDRASRKRGKRNCAMQDETHIGGEPRGYAGGKWKRQASSAAED